MIKSLRIKAGLTQAQLANLAGCTPQVVLKTEQGIYRLMPPVILSALSPVADISPPELERIYRQHQASIRKSNRAIIEPHIDLLDDRPPNYELFRQRVAGSVMGLCKMLCIHPSQWNRLEKHGGDNGFLLEALRDVMK